MLFKIDTTFWGLYTDMLKSKQRCAIFLSLASNICECVCNLTPIANGKDISLKFIIARLDKIYLCDNLHDFQGIIFAKSPQVLVLMICLFVRDFFTKR